MLCRNCGKEIPDDSRFCPVCGEKIGDINITKNETSSVDKTTMPIIEIIKKIKRHKRIYIIIFITIVILGCGYIGFSKYQAKEQENELVKNEIQHLLDIIGTYKSTGYNNIKLTLLADNTAQLVVHDGGYDAYTCYGHWEEKTIGYPIEIDFSDSFKISIGSKYDEYCSSLYFYSNALWLNLSSIQSHDYSACESLKKQESK